MNCSFSLYHVHSFGLCPLSFSQLVSSQNEGPVSGVTLPFVLGILSHLNNIPQDLGSSLRKKNLSIPILCPPLSPAQLAYPKLGVCFSYNLPYRDIGAPHPTHCCPPAVQLCGRPCQLLPHEAIANGPARWPRT